MDGIIRSDRLFTLPSVVAILASGVAAASIGQTPILRTGWILWARVLFAVSGVLFALQVAPLQRQRLALAPAGNAAGSDYARYRAVALRWELPGALALLTPAAGLVLMVPKPDLRL